MDYTYLSWKEKRRRIFEKIKKISDHYGRDDIEWLREYAKCVINTYKDELEVALKCFDDLEAQLKYMKSISPKT